MYCKVYALILSAALSSCAATEMTSDQRFADHTSRCTMMGAKTEEQMFQCRVALQQSSMQVDEEKKARRAQAWANFGAAIQRQQAINAMYQPRMASTTCTRQGVFTNCSTSY